MEKTIHDGDRFLLSKLNLAHQINREDIIVAKSKCYDEPCNVIKRVVGLPNDTVTIYKDGAVAINDCILPREEQIDSGTLRDEIDSNERYPSDEVLRVELENSQYFVLGDNRNNSNDSRQNGPVELSEIIGVVIARVYPFDSITNEFNIPMINIINN